jgi:hypothetical protein
MTSSSKEEEDWIDHILPPGSDSDDDSEDLELNPDVTEKILFTENAKDPMKPDGRRCAVGEMAQSPIQDLGCAQREDGTSPSTMGKRKSRNTSKMQATRGKSR